ncbi:mycothiol synthase [Catenulispora pinisilvae]|uniref:mycothiol synthase n=1 Tax=Catenulispora pinisilvae TaxID=2705253 RepID=UPI0018922C7E|nr:mycothiol synthase [Catenulispora pinisilvae]
MTGISIGVVRRPNEADVATIRSLAEAAERADGVAPLPEQVLLHLKNSGDTDAWHFVARRLAGPDKGSELIGYAFLDKSNPEEGPAAEIVVAPEARRQGVGGALLDSLRMKVRRDDKPVRVWAHGALPAAAALAAKRALLPVRELWVMARPLAEVPPTVPADGIRIAAFRPGVDDEAWVAVNSRAFAHHPEQGAMTVADLHERMAESWFDPEGFFLAWRGEKLAGFHWTKVHDHSAYGDGPVGEVYVLGLEPDEQGRGLGRTLTQVGLQYLHDRGLGEVILYVEADNAPAVAVYTKLGFTRRNADIMYQV